MFTTTTHITVTEDQLSRFTGYPVSVPVFEGPLDLLLYLIRRQEIDISDIPIASITGQFLDFLALMEELDLEVAADFLVMAATLLEIKSRMLLPRPPVLLEEDDAEEEDPRAELVRRLLEYQQYKSAATDLQQRAEAQRRLFARSSVVPNLALPTPDPLLAGTPDAFSLWTALQEVLARIESSGPTIREVARQRVSIRQQMLYILHQLELAPQGITFDELFFSAACPFVLTRQAVIVTFLALLELMRMHRVMVAQDELFGEIRLVPLQAHLATEVN